MTTFDEIIDFAIQREKDAVAFYEDLKTVAKFQAQKELLEEFRVMEIGHVRLLEGVKKRKSAEGLHPSPSEDLKLADYLVEAPPAEDMTYQDILIIAIKKEERAMSLYGRLHGEVDDTVLKETFGRLREEEENHKHHFEGLYDREILREN